MTAPTDPGPDDRDDLSDDECGDTPKLTAEEWAAVAELSEADPKDEGGS